MKIEATIIEMESGEVTVLEYQNVLFFQHPPVKEQRPFDLYDFGGR